MDANRRQHPLKSKHDRTDPSTLQPSKDSLDEGRPIIVKPTQHATLTPTPYEQPLPDQTGYDFSIDEAEWFPGLA